CVPKCIKLSDALKVFDKTALNLYKTINSVVIPRDLYALNISINYYVHLNQVNHGFALLATIFKLGHPPNFATYTTLVNGLVLVDRVFESAKALCISAHTKESAKALADMICV
ncbi:putative tetratricopeptide-like helical domain superfamily protein, partial [Tanacetum coccineum]